MEAVFAGDGKEEVAGWIEGYLFREEGGIDDDPDEGKGGGSDADANGSEVNVVEGDDIAKEESEAVEEIVAKTEDVRLQDGRQ
jgi:hypothetical protein